jgi:Fe-S-cluster containining protein
MKELDEHKHKLEEARKISIHDTADEVRRIGFECIRCGECCRGEDNSVLAFPHEIKRIISATGEKWLHVAEPPSTGEWDCDGNFHTLEWRLRRKDDNCKYYSDNGCLIYSARPALCMTYPFYLEDGLLKFSECSGLGKQISTEASIALAQKIVERYITEIEEAILLISRYEDFERGVASPDGLCIVHDSEGEHRLKWDQLPCLQVQCTGKEFNSHSHE